MDEEALERLSEAEQLMDGACAIIAALRESGMCEAVSVLAVLNLSIEAAREDLLEALRAPKQEKNQTRHAACR